MTVRELNVYASAMGRLRRQEQELTEVNIYSAAMVLRACLFSKHAPALEKVFPHLKVTETDEDMDDEALYRQVAALNRMFGGEEG
nr:MAG TPA: hypothetical protein [Caudoviricetes sp.]